MRFDARAVAKLPSGEHMTLRDFQAYAYQASTSRKSWTYRYKSPIDGRMRQVKLVSGRRPHLPQRSLRGKRSASNAIPVPNLRHCAERESAAAHPGDYTVRQLCRDYLEGYVEVNRKTKGAVEVARIFKAMLGPIGDMRVTAVTRAQAFDFLESYRSTPAPSHGTG
ncbi:hypothetical protein [Paraburkholderia sp. MM5384-R2]|uniref:hypothetical protein n=1 Tax=Paraburkholderia sp. MM5384-R2 TaxID=2723097 RepID=UPI0017D29566|nr:hypothetical protein [Paraburkholderia sp. MM5384-R2]MBB5499454.1 hypothetical protein [Paraburkholderia sp. MM5384-R2]